MIQTKEFMDNVSQWADICKYDLEAAIQDLKNYY